MTIQRKEAITLMELMLVMVIIGVITAAGITISKSNSDYEKKLNLYIVQRDLSIAAKNIATVGSRVYVTEYTKCRNRNTSNSICEDNGRKTKVTGMLPYVSNRTNAADPNANANNYNYNRLLQGFCQRLAEEYGVSTTNNNLNCNNTISTYIRTVGTSFASRNPIFTLPNGHAYYLSTNLYRYKSISGVETPQSVSPMKNVIGGNITLEKDIDRMLSCTTPVNDAGDFSGTLSAAYRADISYDILVAISHYNNKCNLSAGEYIYPAIAPEPMFAMGYFLSNMDFFVVYVDINGKMADANDVAHGPDQLNSDIFTFLVLRSGIVTPAEETDAVNLLLAKIYERSTISNSLTPISTNPIRRYKDALYLTGKTSASGSGFTFSNYFDIPFAPKLPGDYYDPNSYYIDYYIELLKPSLR